LLNDNYAQEVGGLSPGQAFVEITERDAAMAERLVDVLNGNRAVLHTYPITIGTQNIVPNDTVYRAKAVKAAAHAQLVPDADLKSLTTRMHVSRGGALAPYGDCRGMLSETKQGLDQVVRERAYLLWEEAGCPHVARRNTGIALMTSVYASVPTFFGNRKAARMGGPKNSGTRAANSRRSDLPRGRAALKLRRCGARVLCKPPVP
jgi:hypothetical protein